MTTGIDLLAPGVTITLTDGTALPLVYSFRGLALIEARFGSVSAVQGAIRADGAAFGPLIEIIGAGAVASGQFEPHIREHQDAKGKRHVTEIVYKRRDGKQLGDLLHPGRLDEYTTAFTKAFEQSLKSAEGNGEAAAAARPVETVTPSPGLSATTSPSVPSTFHPSSSGT
ncbi:hypothetical protein FCH28_09760 [Streptomyces piniterrae]|uniref:Uncharacterized protein n=1 Tax=Streptomyces piniterrae TaxID=2571125 RepID=A0A4U0NMK5_9ACTN|nr:hypothetical protein [Streptomyces piniterrae]TJZ55615.1 hypothetical protein FCH28_09760 [Streptomyces piniterrae]